MRLKTLRIGQNLEESIPANGTSIFPQVCTDNFDDYADHQWPCHWHSEIEIGIVTNGTVEFTIYGEEHRDILRLEPGDGIYIGQGCLHSAKGISPDSIIMEAVFSDGIFSGSSFGIFFSRYLQMLMDSGVKYIMFNKSTEKDKQALSAISEMCTQAGDSTDNALHAMESLCKICRQLLDYTQKSSEKKPFISTVIDQRIKNILSYIHAHFSEHITIDDLCRSACISRTVCFRIFKDVLGQSPVEYLTQYRLSHACSLLMDSDYTVSEIAGLCGYENPSFFGKIFKDRYGVTPNMYRKATHTSQNAAIPQSY